MRRSPFGRTWPNVIAVVLIVFFVFPVYWMIATAFKQDRDIISKTPVFIPFDATFDHFGTAVDAPDFWTYVTNSVTVTVGAVVISLVIATLAAFAVARMKFRGRKAFVLVIMMAQMAPWEVMTIAVYMISRDNDMLNSLLPLTLFYMMMVLPFTIWTLRGFIAAVPKELEESAMVDGCTRTQAFVKVIFPLLAPATATVVIIKAITIINDMYIPYLYMPKNKLRTLTTFLMDYANAQQGSWQSLAAGIIVIMLPTILIYVFFQRYILAGVSAGAVKE